MTNQNELHNLENAISNQRARLSTDRMDISFGELINMYKQGELIIKPEYQRLFRWSSYQKTALIESVLLGIPIPPIFVSEDKNGIWELIDGLQRLSTIISFFGDLDKSLLKIESKDEVIDGENTNYINKWYLESGSLIEELEGYNVDTLPKKYVLNIKRAVCRVEILRGESNTAMKYELFKRLNSGGSVLTPQEIRNAIYRGRDKKINLLTEELSKLPLFKKFVVLSRQKLFEQYDQELVLRFIAYYDNIEKVNSNTESYLDHFMENAVNDKTFNVDFYRRLFKESLTLLDKNCKENVFRNEYNSFVPAYYEGIMIGISQNIDKYKENPSLINQKIAQLKSDEEFKRFSGSASNSKSRIRNRLRRANEIFLKESNSHGIYRRCTRTNRSV